MSAYMGRLGDTRRFSEQSITFDSAVLTRPPLTN